jgi:hypothetical protein
MAFVTGEKARSNDRASATHLGEGLYANTS